MPINSEGKMTQPHIPQITTTLAEAARTLLRSHLDDADVHPCDHNNDAARARACRREVGELYEALAAYDARKVQAGPVAIPAEWLKPCASIPVSHQSITVLLNAVKALLTAPAPAAEDDKRDAERYRWLRDQARREGFDGGWTGVYRFPHIPAWDDTPYSADRGRAFHYMTLDAAIDAAMQATKETGHE